MIARFAVGDRVRTREPRSDGHTRLPAYLARRCGRIEAVHGECALADDRARGVGPAAMQPLYSVVFEGGEVWGPGAGRGVTIAADLWDAYLEPEEE